MPDSEKDLITEEDILICSLIDIFKKKKCYCATVNSRFCLRCHLIQVLSENDETD